jgi:hypothetical protein
MSTENRLQIENSLHYNNFICQWTVLNGFSNINLFKTNSAGTDVQDISVTLTFAAWSLPDLCTSVPWPTAGWQLELGQTEGLGLTESLCVLTMPLKSNRELEK